MTHDQVYKKYSDAWGVKVNDLLISVLPELRPAASFLDLGCGQGKEALFMARNGFRATAVDSSAVATEQLGEIARAEGLDNLRAIAADIKDYEIEKDKYDLIYGGNVLQFLSKDDARKVIERIKENIAPDGFVILASFTTADPIFKTATSDRMLFEPQEMKNLFKGFKIISYFEGIVKDAGHASMPNPHEHGVVRIVAQKTIEI